MNKEAFYINNSLSELKLNPWDIYTPSTPLIYLSVVKSRKILLYKYMAML